MGSAEISLETCAEEVVTWDSLGQINIIVALERELGEGISALEDLAGARSVTAILSVLREHAKLPV